MKYLIPLIALAVTLSTPAAAKSCKGNVALDGTKVTVGKCWTDDTEAKELIAGACGEGDKCEVNGAVTRANEIKRVYWASGPKGMSFKMKPCPKCVEGLEEVLRKK
jgi:hypothetical protein